MVEKKKIKVLLVDDSPTVLDLLKQILDSDPQIEVIGKAYTGKRALEFIKHQKPDVISMDMDMPEMNGLEATRIIMETDPIPIIIVSSSWSPSEVNNTYNAMDAGAVAILSKPRGIGHPDHNRMAINLIRHVKAMSEVKLVKRMSKIRKEKTDLPPVKVEHKRDDIKIIAIGGSTGALQVFKEILILLPKNLPVPVLIVQHIAKGFLDGFVGWLVKLTGQQVHVAGDKEKPIPGHFYVAPNGLQMGINGSGNIDLSSSDPMNNLCPSVSWLFRSVADNYGKNAIGVLLTGMGKDGSYELKMMSDKGAITIAQDEKSSVIFGMPGEAVKLGGARYILPPEKIAEKIKQLVGAKK
ncbi:MAG: chemotaxis-specific protein-glutamate methyltransferase CheB [Bacteroidales bacterium]|nr:chemotaxis-specific protein-glutamate methyltransferase CheB [Bacteroidales bacterium]